VRSLRCRARSSGRSGVGTSRADGAVNEGNGQATRSGARCGTDLARYGAYTTGYSLYRARYRRGDAPGGLYAARYAPFAAGYAPYSAQYRPSLARYTPYPAR
jgi:hypothetical protein